MTYLRKAEGEEVEEKNGLRFLQTGRRSATTLPRVRLRHAFLKEDCTTCIIMVWRSKFDRATPRLYSARWRASGITPTHGFPLEACSDDVPQRHSRSPRVWQKPTLRLAPEHALRALLWKATRLALRAGRTRHWPVASEL